MTEITEDRDFKTNINVESQTINYIKNPEKFKEDLQKAKNEVEDLGNAVKNTSNPLGKDKRNIFSNLRAQRWVTSFYNVIGSRVEELARQFKAREINEEDLKEALRDIVKGYGKDIGIDFDVVYLDESTMPKDSKGSTGSSYIVDRKNRKVLIPIDVNKIEDIKKVLGTLTEEVAHGKDALEGRQDKKVAEDKSNDEEGLESLGRPANEYVKKKFGEDNNSKIKLTTDGIDLSNADVGEKVGDVITSGDRVFRTSYQSKYKYIQIDFDRAINGGVGLTGSVFRGGASYGLMSIGYSLAFAPEPFATKALGAGFMLGGLIAGAFTASDAVESAQDVYYGVTNQRDKKSVNFGRELLGEDTYDPLNTLSVAGMPILYDQANYTKVMVEGEAAKRAIIYNPNLTYDENKYLNDYMGKEMPGKIASKYNDVNKYEYNATTNPGPLAEGKNPPINNFYGGMYNDASNESGIFVRMGDKIKPYGSWYTKVSKNSEVEARVDLAIKKWWVNSNGEIKIRGFESDKSILDTMYYIEFPEGIPKYKGPVGYQGGPFLGGLDQEQYFIPNSRKFGKVIKSHPIK